MRNARLLVILLVAATVLVDLASLSVVAGSYEWPLEWPHPPFVVLFALATSQVSLVAIWAGLGRTWLPWRVVSLVLTIMVWSRLLAWSQGPELHETLLAALIAAWLPSRTFLSEPEWFDAVAAQAGLHLLAQCICLVLLSSLARMAGFKLIRAGSARGPGESVAVQPRWQFSLSYLLSWITVLAVTLGALQHTFDHRLSWDFVASFWAGVVVMGLAHAALALVALWTALGTQWPGLWGTALALTTVAAVTAVHTLANADILLAYGAMCVVQVVWILASLWVFRIAGYRIVREPRARPSQRPSSPDGQ